MGFLDDVLGLGSDSTSTINNTVTTKMVAQAMSKTIMKCGRSALLSQSVEIIGSGNVVEGRQIMAFNLDASCLNKAENISNMRQDVIAAIDAAASAQNVGLVSMFANSQAQANTTITSAVENIITTEAMTQLVSQVQIAQRILVYGDKNIVNVTQEITADIVDRAAQDVASRIETVQKIDAAVKATADAKVENPFDVLFDFLTDAGWMTVIVIVVVIIAGVLMALNFSKIFRGSDGKPDKDLIKAFSQITARQPTPQVPVV